MESAAVVASQAAAHEAVADRPRAELVIALGRAYHQSGVASDQLEELMHRAADALDLELQVSALPTSITVACGPPEAQQVVLLRLAPGEIDLRRLALLNEVLDRIGRGSLSMADALVEVRRIAAIDGRMPAAVIVAAYCALSTGVAIVLGGGLHEALASAAIGVAVGVVSLLRARVAAVERLFEVLAGCIATVIASLYARNVAPLSVYVPLVAGVVQVLPGWLTTALQELASHNLVAGTSRLGSVFMTLLSLGCGFALGIALVGPGALHSGTIHYAPVPAAALLAAVAAVAFGIGVLERSRKADFGWVFGSCALAELAYRAFAATPAFQVATFAAAFAVAVFANVGARYLRVPRAVLLIPGVIMIVPSSLSYESILYIIQSNAADAGPIALNAVVASVEIVSGVLLAQLIVAPRRITP